MICGDNNRFIPWRLTLKCITKHNACQDLTGRSAVHPLVDEQWATVLQMLPESLDLEATAKETKALLRKRKIKKAGDLLRLVLAYAVCDWSLRLVPFQPGFDKRLSSAKLRANILWKRESHAKENLHR